VTLVPIAVSGCRCLLRSMAQANIRGGVRPHPLSGRWRRTGAIAGLIAAVLLVAALMLLASSPLVGSPGRAIVAYLQARYAMMLAASYTGVLTSVMLIPFVASLTASAWQTDGETQWRRTITLISAAAAVSLILAGATLLASATVLADQTADASAVSALFAGAKACQTLALTPLGLAIVTNARTLSSAKASVRWLSRVDLETGILALASSLVIFLHGDWLGVGEQVVAGVGILVALWMAATAVVLLEGESAAPRENSASWREA
jgi:hypothetical protein